MKFMIIALLTLGDAFIYSLSALLNSFGPYVGLIALLY